MAEQLAPNPGFNEEGLVGQYINPGEFFFGESHHQIHTILGSCIAITLWHPILHIGGMCHFVLPGSRPVDSVVEPESRLDGRYSDGALTLFERAAAVRGTQLNEYQAKIFGGGKMLTDLERGGLALIGAKNIEAATKHLSDRGIPILVAHVGETGHRRIAFNLSNGDVWVKHVRLN